MRKLKQVLSTMTTLEKLDHIWTYYKLHILGTLLVLALLISWGVSIYNNSKEVLLQGEIINVSMSDAGHTYLTEDTFAAVGGTHDRQTVKIISHFVGSIETDSTAYLQDMKLIAQIEGKELDFLILNEELFQQYALSDFYLDLNEFFTAEEMTLWKDAIAYAESEHLGGTYPAGICLNGTALADSCMTGEDTYYLVFIANTQRLPACRAFWQHILNYKA